MRRQRPSTVRSSVFLRNVLSFAKTCSIGLRSGEYGGKNTRWAPAARMTRRIALPLCEPRLSMTTMSPGRSAGASTYISLETFAVDWTVEDARRIDASTAQSGHEGQGFPMAVRNLGMEPLAAPAPSPKRRHIGLGPSLVEKDETLGCKPCLKTLPYGPPASDIRTLLLARRDAFF